jgi:hypothetical protein
MVTLFNVQLGYCHHCLRPAQVGEFALLGWKHKFFLCSVCLRQLAGDIDSKDLRGNTGTASRE